MSAEKKFGKRIKAMNRGEKVILVLLLVLLFIYAGWVNTKRSEAAVVNYKFQKTSCDNAICTGNSTCNQTTLPNGTPGGSYVATAWDQDDSIEVLNWACTSTPGPTGSCEAANIQDSMFTPAFPKNMDLSAISVDVYGKFETSSAVFFSTPPRLSVKLYDMDPNAACPNFAGGTLIGASTDLVWPYGRAVYGTLNIPLTGISYTIPSGHKIRADLYVWRGYNNIGEKTYAVISFGGNYQTQLNVTQASAEMTTVGPGIDPPNATVGPGGTITDLDAFTLQSSGSNDLVGGITLALTLAGAYNYIDTIAITSDNGTITYGSASSLSSDTVSVTLTTPIEVTASSLQYKVRITPKSHSAMPVVPGGAYGVQGTVTAVAGFYNLTTNNDVPQTVITIDNLSPDNPSWGTVAAGEKQVTLNWANPADADFDKVVILRSTSSVSDAPVEGAAYIQGNVIGSSTVVYAGNLQAFIDTGLTNGINYYYKIFARDTNGNYSTGAATGPHQPNLVITIGNGTDPADSASAPGSIFVLDSFTVVLSDYLAVNIPSVTVGFSSGASAYLNKVEITSDDGNSVKGSVTEPFASDSITIPVGTNIYAGIPATAYKVRVTTKSNTNMPAPPGSLYTLTGSVTGVTSATFTNKAYNDTSSAAVTIDNLSPGNPLWGSYWIDDGGLTLYWANPTDTDFSEVLILRNTSPVTDAPAEGVTYSENAYIGTSIVTHRGGGGVDSNWGLTNGQDYYYKIFAKDTSGNYSTGVETGPLQPNINLYVGDGATPNHRICPGCNETLDAFTLSTNSGTANITSLTFNLSPGTADVLSDVSLYSSDTGNLNSVNNPSSDTIVFPVSISVTTTPKYYYIKITSKTHSSLSLGEFNVTGTISSLATVENIHKTYADTTSATITVDNLPPGNPAWGDVTPLDRRVILNWTNPADADFNKVLILRNTSSITDSPVEGSGYYAGNFIGTSKVIYSDTAQTFTDTNLTNGTDYYYKIFSLDRHGNYSSGAAAGPHKPQPANITASMNAGAAMQGATSIDVNMYYSDDANANNTYTVDYKLSSDSTWTNWVTNASHSASPYSAVMTLSPGIYDIRMTYNDPDGFLGTNQMTATGIDLLTQNITNAGIAGALPGSATSIAVNMYYSDDANANNTYTVDYKLLSDSTWTNWVTNAPHSASPYSTAITGLAPGIYDVRMTYSDPEGVSGANLQTATGIDITLVMTKAGVVIARPGLNLIKVYTPFTNDSNNNNNCLTEYKSSSSGAWITITNQSCSISEIDITGLSSSDTYDVMVTYQDPDGVLGTDVQTVNGIWLHSDKLIHNSRTVGSSHWAGNGGWGVAGGMYGEFTCATCHVKDAPNISRIRDMIILNGSPRMVRFQSKSGPDSYGDDSTPRSMPATSRICEVCHTQTSGHQYTPNPSDPNHLLIGPIHQYEQPDVANHFNANSTPNCTKCCHTHETGFAIPQIFGPNCSE